MFTPLGIKSAYSLLKSPIPLKKYVETAKEKGYTTIVLSEWQTLSSAMSFYRLCQSQQVKPVIALNMAYRQQPIHVVALNTKGYFELIQISSALLTQQDIHLEQYENLAVVLIDETRDFLDDWLTKIPKHRLYMGVSSQDLSYITEAERVGVGVIATQSVSYLNPSDYATLKVLEAVDKNETIEWHYATQTGSEYLPTADVFIEKFESAGLRHVVDATKLFYEQIDLDIPVAQKLVPKFSENADQLLEQVAIEGLKVRSLDTDIYRQRLYKELDIIARMGFSDYFLIVWDVMRFAHDKNIMTGAGRGSSAASLVSYCLNITQVDPVKENLLFERFLNPERYTMPDIDLDFPDNKRQEILQYVAQKYGKEQVAQIATFGTFAAKQALRDVARVFGFNQQALKTMTNLIPNELRITLDDAYQKSVQLRQWIERTEQNHLIFTLAKQIEGLPRHVSTHAAGVVISDKVLTTLVPVQQSDNQLLLTQFTMQDVEYIGLLKMDFLGLKNLSILADAQQAVRQLVPDFNVWHIDWQDDATLQLFAQADTQGIFQFESAGIKRVLQQVKPNTLGEVVAVNALYRPGPMEQIGHFVARKHKQENVQYPHQDLQPILEDTYGIIVYQEQVMQIAYHMAGFSLGKADLLRRAIGKMQKDVMAAQRQDFISGAMEKGYSKEDATQIFQYIEKFASYGFPKSHAFAYSMLAYQLAYIKVHYPSAFYLALLLHTNPKSQQYSVYIMEAKQHGVHLELPHINNSYGQHRVMKKQTILLGLSSIQGVRRDVIAHILTERKTNGVYRSFANFVERLPEKFRKKDILEPLIFSGACDCFGETRATLYENIDAVTQSIHLLLGIEFSLKFEQHTEYDESIIRQREKETLGISLSYDPLQNYTDYYTTGIVQKTIDSIENQSVTVLGNLRNISRIATKNGKRMAFAMLEDMFGDISLTLFPETYVHFLSHLEEQKIIVVKGKVERNKQDKLSIIVQHIQEVSDFEHEQELKDYICYIKLVKLSDFSKVKHIVQQHKGVVPIVLYSEETKEYKKIHEKYSVNFQDNFQKEVESVLGPGRIVCQKKKNFKK